MPARSPAAPAVRLLGPVEVVGPRGRATLAAGRQRGLVGLLALNAGSVVPLSRVVDAMWGEQPPRTAVGSLRSHIARVRQALTACGLDGVLITRGSGYLLALPREEVDVGLFEHAVHAGRCQVDASAPQAAIESFRDALALWRGDALADCELSGWAVADIERLHELRLAAYEDMWHARLGLGEHAAAVNELERALVGQPVRERLVELLMVAMYRSGRPAAALDRYERLRARLAEDLGARPGPQVQRTYAAILRSDRSLDLAGTSAATAPVPAQLPPPVGHFAGRG